MRAIQAQRRGTRRWLRPRLVMVGSTFGIAAVVLLTLLLVPSDADARAYATLDSIRTAPRESNRVYRIHIDSEPSSEGVDPRTRHQKSGFLVLGPRGCWTLSFMLRPSPSGAQQPQVRPPAGDDGVPPRPARGQVVFGCDGTSYWMVLPDGRVRRAHNLKELRPPLIVGALDSSVELNEAQTDDLEPLTLDALLDRLDRGFTTSFEQPKGEGTRLGRPLSVVTFDRRGTEAWRTGVKRVRVVADAATHEVLSAQWTWIAGAMHPEGDALAESRRVRIDLVERESADGFVQRVTRLGLEWFSPDFHAESRRLGDLASPPSRVP